MISILIALSIVLSLVDLLLLVLVVGLLHRNAVLSWRIDKLEAVAPTHVGRSGLKLGARLPEFSATDTSGAAFEHADLIGGKRTVLAFTQPGCGPCADVMPALNDVARRGKVRVVAVSAGDRESTRSWADAHDAHFPVLCQENLSLSRRFEVFATPFAFLINERGTIINKGVINNAQHVRFLLEQIPSSKHAANGPAALPALGSAADRSRATEAGGGVENVAQA
jgi:methylamine dehydrogenase accessory protein MauD